MTLILSGTDSSVSAPAVQGGTGGTTTGLYYPATNQLALATNGTQALLVDSSQNVGIGTTSPSQKLSVVTGSGTSCYIETQSTGFTSALFGQNNAGDAYVYNGYAGNIRLFTGATERMRIDSSGNVGIGVTPSAWSTLLGFQVQTTSVASFSNTAYFSSNAYYNGGYKYINTAFASQYIQTNGTHQWNTAASGTAGNTISFTQSLAVGKGTTLALEGATSATGTGITFPATQSASSDANTLDDYEEGTWTPVIGGSTSESGQSYNYQYGKYVKVGSLVTFTFDVSLATKGTITGTYLQVKGFPFVPVTAIASGAVSYYASLVTGYYWIGFYVDPASNFAYMVGSTSASLSYLGPANVQNGSRLTGSVSFSTV